MPVSKILSLKVGDIKEFERTKSPKVIKNDKIIISEVMWIIKTPFYFIVKHKYAYTRRVIYENCFMTF